MTIAALVSLCVYTTLAQITVVPEQNVFVSRNKKIKRGNSPTQLQCLLYFCLNDKYQSFNLGNLFLMGPTTTSCLECTGPICAIM